MSQRSNVKPDSHPVRLFRNGANQAVRIPREFELPGADAIMTREAGAIVIRPAPPHSLLALLRNRVLIVTTETFVGFWKRPANRLVRTTY